VKSFCVSVWQNGTATTAGARLCRIFIFIPNEKIVSINIEKKALFCFDKSI
jgi:hypothetical protein